MRRALACLALVLACAWAFAPLRANGFVNYDDPKYLTENPLVQRGLSAAGLRWAFTNEQTANFHPLTWLSHMLDVELFGLDPGPHHLVSLGLHALAACALCLALEALGLSLGAALAVALLFAVHPLRVESVAWASERKDVLCALFFALALRAWAAWARHGRRTGYALALLALALGLCAKAMLVTLPLVLLVLDRWPLERARSRRLVLEKLPFFALSAAFAALTVVTQRAAGAVRDQQRIGLAARLANAARSAAAYVAESVFPSDLAVFYPHPAIARPDEPAWGAPALLALAALVAASALAWRLRARLPALLAGWAWFLVMLLPVIGLVQVGEQARADRYTYLPSIGLALALVGALERLTRARPRARRALVLPAALALLLLGSATRAQARLWHDSRSLFSHALDVDEQNDVALLALAELDLQAGDHAAARAGYERALALRPDLGRAHNGLGIALQRQGQPALARASFERALALDPGDPQAANNLGIACAQAGEGARALELFERAVRLRPGFGEALRNRGGALLGLGRWREALDAFDAAERVLGPDARLLEDRARAHEGLGEPARAAALYERALALAPQGAPPLGAALGLAWILATAPDAALRDGARATRLAQACVAATRQGDARALATLAAARAECGAFEEAAQLQERAVARAGASAALYAPALERYRAGEPWREGARR